MSDLSRPIVRDLDASALAPASSGALYPEAEDPMRAPAGSTVTYIPGGRLPDDDHLDR